MKILINEKLSEHKYKTPEGYLICVDSVLARTGKQTYRRNEVFGDSDDDSEIEIDRPAKEVFSDATLASFENKPITVEHPDEDVNAENYKDYAVGFVRDVHKGIDNGMGVIVGTLVITDAKTIEEIENGEHTDLSCGYDCDIMDEENPYQRNIRGNHVALCTQGRAGNARIVDTAVKDKEETMTRDEIIDELLEDGNSFTYKNVLVIKTPYGWKFKLNGKTYEVATDEEAKEEIDESIKDCDMKDGDVDFFVHGQEVKTYIWNKNEKSAQTLSNLASKYGIIIKPDTPRLYDKRDWLNISATTKLSNVKNLFEFFAKVNNTYTVERLKQIYEAQTKLKVDSIEDAQHVFEIRWMDLAAKSKGWADYKHTDKIKAETLREALEKLGNTVGFGVGTANMLIINIHRDDGRTYQYTDKLYNLLKKKDLADEDSVKDAKNFIVIYKDERGMLYKTTILANSRQHAIELFNGKYPNYYKVVQVKI